MALLVNMTDYLIRIVALELSGRLDVFEVPVLRKACDDLIEQGIVHLVFDLSRVEIIDSSGLAVLVGALKRTRMLNGDVRLIWPRAEAAARVLKLTRFDQVFTSIEPDQIIPRGF